MRKLYLSSWINFGKYRRTPSNLKKILDTEEGRKWFRWLMDNTYDFEFDFAVIEYLKLKEEDANTYYQRSEVSNSDLTELKNLLYPRTQYGDKEKAFKFGSLVDAMLTEPERVRYDKHMVDDVLYSGEDWELAQAMIKSLRMEARRDPLIKYALEQSDKQKFMINKNQKFQYGNFEYTLDTRCKWDFWFSAMGFGGDLKTTFASSQKQFNEAIDFFDWDRSRAWYMDIAGSKQDFIVAISKKNQQIFKATIKKDDTLYKRGKEKYEELAFKWWMLIS